MSDEINHLPTKSTAEASLWLTSFGVPVTERFIRDATDKGTLPCQIVGGKRTYSTAALYEWVISLSARTARPGRKPR